MRYPACVDPSAKLLNDASVKQRSRQCSFDPKDLNSKLTCSELHNLHTSLLAAMREVTPAVCIAVITD